MVSREGREGKGERGRTGEEEMIGMKGEERGWEAQYRGRIVNLIVTHVV